MATIKANNAIRADVRAAYGNNPNIPLDCGFVWAIPNVYKTGHPITIKVVPANDVAPIGNSPLTTSGDCNNPGTNNPGYRPPSWKDFPLQNPSYLSLLNFFSEMSERGISFTDEEKEVIAEYPDLMNSIRSYVNQYGQKPDGSNTFIMSGVDQQKYPRFTAMVKSMPDFVDQHDRVKQALIRHTKLPWSKIKVLLKFGSGPKIEVYELSPDSYYGPTVYPAYPEPFIEVSARYVRGLEAASLSGTREATAFLLTVTLLHELTHYGAVDGGRNESRNDEFGDDFEREVLGTTITKNNAGQLVVDFNKQN